MTVQSYKKKKKKKKLILLSAYFPRILLVLNSAAHARVFAILISICITQFKTVISFVNFVLSVKQHFRHLNRFTCVFTQYPKHQSYPKMIPFIRILK